MAKKPQVRKPQPVNINLGKGNDVTAIIKEINKSTLTTAAKRRRIKQALSNDRAIRLSRQGTIKAVGSAFAQNTAAPTAAFALKQSNALINAIPDSQVKDEFLNQEEDLESRE